MYLYGVALHLMITDDVALQIKNEGQNVLNCIFLDSFQWDFIESTDHTTGLNWPFCQVRSQLHLVWFQLSA